MRRFAYVILAADELVAVSQLVRFHYDDGTTALSWKIGESVDPVVWISLFLFLVLLINMLPVKVCRAVYICSISNRVYSILASLSMSLEASR